MHAERELVSITQFPPLCIHDISHNPICFQTCQGEDVIQGSRRSLASIFVKAESIVSVGPGVGVLLLPHPPEPVDLGVMKKEEGVYSFLYAVSIPFLNRRQIDRERKKKNSPLGEAFWNPISPDPGNPPAAPAWTAACGPFSSLSRN